MKAACAFCHKHADMTGEHLWSDWTNSILGANKYDFQKIDHIEGTCLVWTSKSLNLKARVVCKDCNNGWMSDIENRRAKPVISEMMKHSRPFSLSAHQLESLAIFAFKTFVVADHMMDDRKPFFSPALRSKFRISLAIPSRVQMWLAMASGGAPAIAWSNYTQSRGGLLNGIEFYFFTYRIGPVVIQIAAHRWRRRNKGTSDNKLVQDPNMDSVSATLWPLSRNPIRWPLRAALGARDIEPFCKRWDSLFLQRINSRG